MKCTFYRPTQTNLLEYENIVGKLRSDLYQLETHPCDERETYLYVFELSKLFETLPTNPRMSFLGLGNPNLMPRDARVEFFYLPTYLATAFIIKSVILFPSLLDSPKIIKSDIDFSQKNLRKLLTSCLWACTGRNFNGAGVLRLKDCIKLFEDAGTTEFLKKYPNLCPTFTKLYTEKKALVDSGEDASEEDWFY